MVSCPAGYKQRVVAVTKTGPVMALPSIETPPVLLIECKEE
jgi:hypothetical protein